ncbi:hypothetical protein [Streptomyces sulphureus]|uniref:hypothetical protein n=1 Tax=Streptomyces sulphureus TaxID=47758 RepID=UPI0003810B7E|nr:hypothetical protein [Streptomyces sulphureus]
MTTHNGRGGGSADDDAQPAAPYEGVVLPANGEPWTPQQQHEREAATSGHAWGAPWGPESEAVVNAPAPPPAPPQRGHREVGPEPHHSQQALPQGQYGHASYGGQQAYEQPHRPQPPGGAGRQSEPGLPVPRETEDGRHALPPLDAEPPSTGRHPGPLPQPGQPPSGLPGMQPEPLPEQGGGQLPPFPHHSGPMPPAGTPPMPPVPPLPPEGAPPPPQGAPPPPEPSGPSGGYASHSPQDTAHQWPGAFPQAAHPQPPQGGSEAESTQLLPPMIVSPEDAQYGGSEDGTQFIPQQSAAPQPAGPDAQATQYIPPVTDAPQDNETQRLRATPPSYASAPSGGEEEVRRPLAEFDSLFRAEPAGGAKPPEEPAAATQSLPLFDQASAGQQRGFGAEPFDEYEPQGRAARRNAERGKGANPGVLVGVGVAGVVLVGLVAGALIGGGGDGDDDGSKAAPAPTEPAGNEASSKAPDPVEQQAKSLDRLLSDSNNSRNAVIRSVDAIKNCSKLPKAASDLRAAAQQRKSLVTRLEKLKTDKLPEAERLRAALTRAWRSSEAADRHYASWADQTAGKGGCPGGNAKQTHSAGAGNRASGAATNAKKEAASLWNPTAEKYGLDKREFSQL